VHSDVEGTDVEGILFSNQMLYSHVNFADVSRRQIISSNINYPVLGQTCILRGVLTAPRNNITSLRGTADLKHEECLKTSI